MKNITLIAKDGYELSIKVYEVKNPIAYVQVIHGMQEYQDRYEYLATQLNKHNITVITSDIRGHGPTAPILGYFAERDGYKQVLNDQKVITEYILNKYNTNKVIILGHSMGSMIARNLLQTESKNYQAIILSGYPNYNPAAPLAILIAKTIRNIKGGMYYSKLLTNLSVGSFNKSIKDPKTPLDWLSYNEENVAKYMENPYCGHEFLTSAFVDLFTFMNEMNKVKNYTDVKNIPILLLRGEDDPCVGGNKGSFSSIKTLAKAGFKNLTELKYEKMRHEILNENAKDKVINDIINFIEGEKE